MHWHTKPDGSPGSHLEPATPEKWYWFTHWFCFIAFHKPYFFCGHHHLPDKGASIALKLPQRWECKCWYKIYLWLYIVTYASHNSYLFLYTDKFTCIELLNCSLFKDGFFITCPPFNKSHYNTMNLKQNKFTRFWVKSQYSQSIFMQSS